MRKHMLIQSRLEHSFAPCWIVLHDFQEKTKIAATTRNNDGCW